MYAGTILTASKMSSGNFKPGPGPRVRLGIGNNPFKEAHEGTIPKKYIRKPCSRGIVKKRKKNDGSEEKK